MNDTIAAISSSGGPIGLIRVSGERAIEAINAVFQAKNGKPLTEAPSQKLVYGTLTDKSGNVIDCCYAVALHAPHTYTGETMAELQCHGSTAVLCAGLDALFAQGVRQAEAGEFTRRAFLNGKMGLSEAEAVHDLITARTAEAAQNAAAQVMGAVGSPVQQMRDELLGMVAHFHAVVDFPDEDIDPVLFEDAAALLHRTTSRLYSMAESYERGRILREGVPCVILGRPNAGKSTLLRMLAGFEQPSAGQIMLDGVDLSQVPPYLRPINMMFQSYALFPHMTVEQNIAFGLKQDKLPKAEIVSRVNEMLGLVHMQEFAKRKPHQLSGGQRQRVALARSLAKRPKLLLLDEPMGALDKKLRDRMQLEVVDILERVGVTCVMVTHDQEEAMTMAGRIAIMNRGKFVQIGEPEEIYEHPTTRYSAEFIGSVNVFEGVLKERQEDGLVLDSPGLVHPLKVDADASVVDNVPVHVALRPEKIMLCEEPPANGCNFAVGEVIHIAYLGDLSVYHVRLKSGQMISAQLQNAHRHRKGLPTWGDEVRLCWDADSCVVLTV